MNAMYAPKYMPLKENTCEDIGYLESINRDFS